MFGRLGFNTLLCHRDGILVLDTIVNRDVLARHFSKHGMSQEKISSLLDPNDPQNVPRAVQLLHSIIKVKEHSTHGYLPDEQKEHTALLLLGEVYNTLLTPFITLTMSLSEQFKHLATYVHLAFYLYRKYRTAFMTSQLYNDTQHMIKSLVFNLAKQQLLNEDCGFWIIQLGQDRLEVSFADARTQDHARNFDVLTLARKLGTGRVMNGLYLKHPTWDRGHRRLKFFDNEGPDHINPRSWSGDVVVKNVSLQWGWLGGRDSAIDILKCFGFVDARAIFDQPNLDLFCPLGDGRIVGVSEKDSDRSLAADIGDTADPLTEEPDAPGDEPDMADEHVHPDVDLEDLLSTEAHSHELQSCHGSRINERYLEVVHANGQRESYNIHSIVRCALTPKYARKSLERQLRAAGIPRDRLRQTQFQSITAELTDPTDSMVCVRDIGATLLRSGEHVSLALVQLTAMSNKGQRVTQIAVDTVGDPKQEVSVSVQILHLVPSTRLSHAIDNDKGTAHSWLWSTSFLRIHVPKAITATAAVQSADPSDGADRGVRKAAPPLQTSQFMITIPGWLFLPLSPQVISVPEELRRDLAQLAAVASVGGGPPPASTWRFPHDSLVQLTTDLWDNAQPYSEDVSDIIEKIPAVSETALFPYSNDQGQHHPNS